MWGPWLSSEFGIHRRDIFDDHISLEEILAMWDAVKE